MKSLSSCFSIAALAVLSLAACSASSEGIPEASEAGVDVATESGVEAGAQPDTGDSCAQGMNTPSCCKSFGGIPAGAGDSCPSGLGLACIRGSAGAYPDHCCFPAVVSQCNHDSGTPLDSGGGD